MRTKRLCGCRTENSDKCGNLKRHDYVEKVTHTPTPWHLEKSGYTQTSVYIYSEIGKPLAHTVTPDFGLDEQEANAAFIVRAVNSHDTLVDAIKFAISDPEYDKDMKLEGLVAALKAAGE